MIALRKELTKSFRRLFIVQDRNVLAACDQSPCKDDLVLSFDYAVVKEFENSGIDVCLIDRVVEPSIMDQYNYNVYQFFETWHNKADGNDLFTYDGIDFGKTFRQEIWNDITYSSRVGISIKAISSIKRDETFCILTEPIAVKFANQFGFNNIVLQKDIFQHTVYVFPVFKWMDEKIRPAGLKHIIQTCKSRLRSYISGVFECIRGYDKKIPGIYLQLYHPTIPIAQLINKENRLKIYTDGSFNGMKKIGLHQIIPDPILHTKHRNIGEKIVNNFCNQKHPALLIDNFDFAPDILKIIENQIRPRMGLYIATVATFVKYFSKRRLDCVVLIANIGRNANVLLSIAHKRNIPSFLIINGYLSGNYCFEGRDADWINGYGSSIKEHYYKKAGNVVELGDPRMDAYVEFVRTNKDKKSRNSCPQIVIGAGGYDTVDLNSCLAAEYLFLDVILKSCRDALAAGHMFDLILKVRPNGYSWLYEKYINEYYPDLRVEIVDNIPMQKILLKADLYLSIFSGTHFEAALLGIPTIYVKTDDAIMDPPFNGKSELRTIFDSQELTSILEMFSKGEHITTKFNTNEILEMYCGKLDGKCTERNYQFILNLAVNRKTNRN